MKHCGQSFLRQKITLPRYHKQKNAFIEPIQGFLKAFYFTNKLWPDFDEEELNNAIKEYNRRTRNFGGK